jgi:hypothetical protein
MGFFYLIFMGFQPRIDGLTDKHDRMMGISWQNGSHSTGLLQPITGK